MSAPVSAQVTGIGILSTKPGASTNFTDYDWTGLHIQLSWLFNGDPNWYPGLGYDGLLGGTAPGSEWYYDTGYNWYADVFKIAISGVSTYKWQWSPPNKRDAQGNDQGTPDLVNFPLPKLFFLARLQGRISADLFYTGDTGITADGKFTDEWTTPASVPAFHAPVNPHLEAKPGTAQNAYASYGIRPTNPDPADTTLTTLLGTLSPTPYVTGMGPDYSSPDAELQLELHEHAFAIELDRPNYTDFLFHQAARTGEGANQFVYGADSRLKLPLKIKLTGAPGDVTAADAQWLANSNKADWQVDIKTGNDGVQHTTTQGYTQYVDGVDIKPRATVQDADRDGNIIYAGLPQANADFGNHTVTRMVNDGTGAKASEKAYIQTFFRGSDTTHYTPNGYAVTPNWWWYYSQEYLPSNATYSPTANASQYDPATGNITISNQAFIPNVIHIYNLQNSIVTWIGDLELKGILRYIKSCSHELGHRTLGTTGTGDGVHTIQADNPTIDPMTGISSDANADGLDDVWQAAHHFPVVSQNTFPTGANVTGAPNEPDLDAGKDNREALCNIIALGELIRLKDKWQKDWAQEGLQYGDRAPFPQATSPYFPWVFYPRSGAGVDRNAGTAQLPANCLFSLSQL